MEKRAWNAAVVKLNKELISKPLAILEELVDMVSKAMLRESKWQVRAGRLEPKMLLDNPTVFERLDSKPQRIGLAGASDVLRAYRDMDPLAALQFRKLDEDQVIDDASTMMLEVGQPIFITLVQEMLTKPTAVWILY